MNARPDLWNQYRETWRAFSTSLDRWQQAAQPDERLRAALDQARQDHKTARDRLAEHLTRRKNKSSCSAS